ncbi:unnamed protein product [Owenia fusiformis]|uniref:FHF complex subunit HOOK-interacting protein C-terminal domain-containing protein n=1 Tax=Owenia fusiformis TaxID=6347 RepID=A0A8S4N6Z0_OWEFU|nr:unnamed protein product [Owenia fusiformis]
MASLQEASVHFMNIFSKRTIYEKIILCLQIEDVAMSWLKKSKAPAAEASPPPGLPNGRPRSETDPETCLEVFKSHWHQAIVIIRDINNSPNPAKSKAPAQGVKSDDVDAVINYIDQMVLLLIREAKEEDGSQGLMLDYLLTNGILDLLFDWSEKQKEFRLKLFTHQLKVYEMLISQAQQSLLVHKPLIKPMMRLISQCADHPGTIEHHLVLLLHQLCINLSNDASLLEIFFSASADHGQTKFLIFSALIPFVHREGTVGQSARDALLLIMVLTNKHESIGNYIADNSDFCPVLATGLSALYSSLPYKLEIRFEDWSRLEEEDWKRVPSLVMFLNSLEFCNAVVQVASPCVRDQLIKFIYHGFLKPVIGPALHQNAMDEVVAATAYLELFLRKITEPALMHIFLKFICTASCDEIIILESLITRINSNTRLCLVSLALFTTLVDLKCEDVMYQLVFKYLIPCTHVMVSQRRSVKDVDLYGKAADKLLSLRPACSIPDDSIPGTPDSENSRSSSPDNSTAFPKGSIGSKLDHYETSYSEYLHDARNRVVKTAHSCQCWSAPYDGETPSPDSLIAERSPSPGLNSSLNISGVSSILEDSVLSEAATRGSTEESPRTSGSCDTSTVGHLEIQNGGSKQIQDKSGQNLNAVKQHSDNNNTETVIKLQNKSELDDETRNLIEEHSGTDTGEGAFSQEESDPQEFNNFLLTLKRAKTPDNICDTIEESLSDFEELLDKYKYIETTRKHKSKSSGLEPSEKIQKVETNITTKPRSNLTDEDLKKESAKSEGQSGDLSSGLGPMDLSMFDSSISASTALNSIPKQVSSNSKEPVVTSALPLPPSLLFPRVEGLQRPDSRRSIQHPVYTPTKYNIGTPNIGPFLTVLLNKLEGMQQNTLYVNFLLTGLLTRLSCYPQPLLRSFLLNHSLVFQPTVKSLFQVLGSVKHKVDCYSYTVDNFDQMLLKA